MFDAFKKKSGSNPAQELADELQALLNTSRDERGALSAMLTKIEVHSKKLTPVSTSLQQVHERATDAQSKLEDLTTRMSAIEARSKGFEQIETKIRSLGDAVTQAEETADRLLAPAGELKKHKQAVEQLSSQAIQTTADLDALKKEQTTLRQLREELQQAQMRTAE